MKRAFTLFSCVLFVMGSFAGKVDTVTIHHEAMNRDIQVVVVTPSGTKAAKNVRYPVVFLLHGATDNCFTWVRVKPNLPDIADEKQMIFVTPSVLNSWYFDSPKLKDYRYETFVSKELIDYIDTHYPTQAKREARTVTGLSMGGHGALFLAMRHTDVFGACGSMSGGVDIRPFPLNWELAKVLGEMASNRKVWDEHTVVNQIGRIKNGDLAIMIDCGDSDFFLEVNLDLHKRLLGHGIGHDFTTRPGDHSSTYWANAIDYQLLFFEKYFRQNGTSVQRPARK